MDKALFRELTKVLDDPWRERLLFDVMNIRTDAAFTGMSEADVLTATVFNHLVACCSNFVTRIELLNVIKLLRNDLIKMQEKMAELSRCMPTYLITVADQRFVAWTGGAQWYDMQGSQYATELPQPAVLTINCNVTALYLRNRRRLLNEPS